MKHLKNSSIDSEKNESKNTGNHFSQWFEDFYFPSERFENLMLHPMIDKIGNEYKE